MQVKRPKIPNYNNYFILKKNFQHKSLDIYFDFFSKLDNKNLYLIIKSIILDKRNLIKSFFIIGAENSLNLEKNRKIFHNLKISKLEKISYIDFKIMLEELIENDWMYMNDLNFKLYGLKINYYPDSYNWKNNLIFPKYPWKNNIIASSIIKKQRWKLLEDKKKINKNFKKYYLRKICLKYIRTIKYRLYNDEE